MLLTPRKITECQDTLASMMNSRKHPEPIQLPEGDPHLLALQQEGTRPPNSHPEIEEMGTNTN